MDVDASLGHCRPMKTDWRRHDVLTKLAEGYTFKIAAQVASISRMTLWRWMNSSPEFADAVAASLEAGKKERTYRAWLYHPFRGRRPPTGKGHGGKPRFTYGRR
jgi:hypothetical protein